MTRFGGLLGFLTVVAAFALPARARAQSRGVLQATATVVDFRASEHALGLARVALSSRASGTRDSALAPLRIEIARVQTARREDAEAGERVVVRMEYLQ